MSVVAHSFFLLSTEHEREVARWCLAQIGPVGAKWDWTHEPSPLTPHFWFWRTADAVHFKLRWYDLIRPPA